MTDLAFTAAFEALMEQNNNHLQKMFNIYSYAERMAVVNDLLRTEIDGEPVEPLITKEQAIKLLDNGEVK